MVRIDQNMSIADKAEAYVSCMQQARNGNYTIYRALKTAAPVNNNNNIGPIEANKIRDASAQFVIVSCGWLDYVIALFANWLNGTSLVLDDKALTNFSNHIAASLEIEGKKLNQLLSHAKIVRKNGSYELDGVLELIKRADKVKNSAECLRTKQDSLIVRSNVFGRDDDAREAESIPEALKQAEKPEQTALEKLSSELLGALTKATTHLNALEKAKKIDPKEQRVTRSGQIKLAIVELNSFVSQNWEKLVIPGSATPNAIRNFLTQHIADHLDMVVNEELSRASDDFAIKGVEDRLLRGLSNWISQTYNKGSVKQENGRMKYDVLPPEKQQPIIPMINIEGQLVTSEEYLVRKLKQEIFSKVLEKAEAQVKAFDEPRYNQMVNEGSRKDHHDLVIALVNKTKPIRKLLGELRKSPIASSGPIGKLVAECEDLVNQIDSSGILNSENISSLNYQDGFIKAHQTLAAMVAKLQAQVGSLQSSLASQPKLAVKSPNDAIRELIRNAGMDPNQLNVSYLEIYGANVKKSVATLISEQAINSKELAQIEQQIVNLRKEIFTLTKTGPQFDKEKAITELNQKLKRKNTIELDQGIIALAIEQKGRESAKENFGISQLSNAIDQINGYISGCFNVLSNIENIVAAKESLERYSILMRKDALVREARNRVIGMHNDYIDGKKTTLQDLQHAAKVE